MNKMMTALALATATFATGASAATCADRSQVVSRLQTHYGETLLANAVSHSNKILEVYGSREKDTWSIFVYLPERDLICLAANGTGIDRITSELQLKF